MNWKSKIAPFLKMRYKTIWKYVVVLSLVTCMWLLIAHKDLVFQKVSRSIPALQRSYEDDLPEDYEFPDETTKPNKFTIKLTATKKSLAVTKTFADVTTMPSKSFPRPTKVKQISTTFNYLGDSYGWDDTYLNSSCSDRTREKLRSQEFKDMFVETIPVFQWKKHALQSEYRRLQRYPGAQGWMGVTWQIVNETLNLLNSSLSGYLFDTWKGQASCVRCAVVGNGGILNGSGMGEEIDGHDYVFRVNGAITKGFENDVGNRTSFFFFSTNTLMNSLYSYRQQGFKQIPRTQETRFLLLPDHDRDYLLVRAALTNSIVDRGRDKSKRPSEYFGENLMTEHFRILHPDFMRYLRNRFLWAPILNTKSRDIYRPTTGGTMLLAAVHTCDQNGKYKEKMVHGCIHSRCSILASHVQMKDSAKKQVSVLQLALLQVSAYGFITPNYSKFSDHYFDTTYKKVVFYSNHNYRKEIELWQKLHNAGVIKLYMRDTVPEDSSLSQKASA